ncbi:transcription termination factor 1 isoform X2 [Salmo trutta]|uniref:transcription termination factor 1 isoform X2 n=1 Tax=Salmo trutta TaxID=8032 RepID=UPI00113053D8|nr:transcription termination factor 1-like isoform X2 [Salmo trutta]
MQNVLKKKNKKTKASEQEQEEPGVKEDQMDGHQLTGDKRNRELTEHKKQTVTELEMVEKERKKRKKQKKNEKQINVQAEMEVPDPEERIEDRTKKKSNYLHTQRVGDDGVTVAEEAMSSWKKKKNRKDRETEERMDSGLSASAVDVSDVKVPEEARKRTKKHKNRQTELEEGAESRQTGLRLADDPEIIAVQGWGSVVTELQKNGKEKRKRKKEKVVEIQLNVCPDETELPGILEQTERKWNTTTRLKTQPHGGAVEGSRRIKRQRCRESDTGMDSVPSETDNRTPDAGPESETGEDGPHTTMIETSAQHRRRIQNDKALSESEWRAMNELKEFVPNVESLSVLKIRIMIKYDLDRFKEFRRQGISLRTGRYSAQENKQLMSNINDFLALTGIENAAKLFHTKRFKDEMTRIRRLKSHHRFHERIAEGIPRPWHKIYSRGGRKMFDGSSYKGRRRFSEDELYSLKKLQTLHGNNWVKISQLTGRSETPLRKRFSQIFANLGPWSEEELKRLMEAVRDHLLGQVEPGRGPATIKKDKLYNNIPWTDVCRRVKTRHRDQCRMKWLGVMAHKMANGQPVFSGGVKTLKAKVDLIKALNAMQVEDATDVDWEEIANTIGGVTPCYVQMHYHKLKVAKVPLQQSMSFCEIIDFLYSSVLPKFENLLRHSQTESGENESRDLHQVQTESGENESRDLHQVQTESGENESRDLHQVQTESGETESRDLHQVQTESRDLHQVQTESGENESRDLHQVQTESRETESRDDRQELFLLSEIFETEDD